MLPSRQSSPYMYFSPSGSNPFPHNRVSSSTTSELEKYLSELLTERQSLGPFAQVLPNCTRLLNQEISRVMSLIGSPYGERNGLDRYSLFSGGGSLLNSSLLGAERTHLNGGGLDRSVWSSPYQMERVSQQGSAMSWHGVPGVSGNQLSSVVKKIIHIEVPVDKYPDFNFVGRLLGPRGNSLKRVETNTGCRVYIRGRGSVRDPEKEEKLRDKPGYEHLNEPLHVLIEAELPVNVIDLQLSQAREIIEELLKPVDESQDYYKKQQLRELAMLNGTLRDDSPCWNGGSVSPFSNSGMKRAKTRS